MKIKKLTTVRKRNWFNPTTTNGLARLIITSCVVEHNVVPNPRQILDMMLSASEQDGRFKAALLSPKTGDVKDKTRLTHDIRGAKMVFCQLLERHKNIDGVFKHLQHRPDDLFDVEIEQAS